MSWNTEMVVITRGLIGDNDPENQSYGDDRLEELLLTAAQVMQTEVSFANTYTISVNKRTLIPDPVAGTKDNGFINLICLRAAYILVFSEFKTESRKAIAFRDGPSSIDARAMVAAKQAVAEQMWKNFEKAKREYQMGSRTPGEAIVGPHRTNLMSITGHYR